MANPQEMSIKTRAGKLVAVLRDDKFFPGIEIELHRKGGRSNCGVWMECDETLSPPAIKMHVYDTIHDEPIFNLNITELMLHREEIMAGYLKEDA